MSEGQPVIVVYARMSWWVMPLVRVMELLCRIRVVEPTVEKIDRFAGWLLDHGIVMEVTEK